MTEIRDLISYRVHQVANLLSRGAELRYRRQFGVSLWEWRTVALLGAAEEPMSLGELARAAGIHKSQMSRVVSGLAKRRLVLCEGLIRAAAQRDHAFRSCLSAAENDVFERVLAKLAGQARELIQTERGMK